MGIAASSSVVAGRPRSQGSGPAEAIDAAALSARIATVAAELAASLAGAVRHDGFPDRTYYGEAFALWLWTYYPENAPQEAIEGAVAAVLSRDMNAPQAHHEFNNLALFHYLEATGDRRVLPPLQEMRIRDNHVPNWVFLRTLGRLLHNRTFDSGRFDERRLRRDLERLLRWQMRPYGLICDTRYLSSRLPLPCFDRPTAGAIGAAMDGLKRLQPILPLKRLRNSDLNTPGAKLQLLCARSTTFMYHCFDLASLYSIMELTGWECAEDAFRRGVEFISGFVLRNGDTIYLGRGQQQLFPYGALIFALSAAAARWNEQRYLAAAERAFDFVMKRRRPDGSLPLVVQPSEAGWPDENVRAASPEHPGWYRYNNFYDYQAAFPLFLARAAEVLREAPKLAVAAKDEPLGLSLYGQELAMWRNDLYEAFVSAPGGYLANAMPVPYICFEGESVTPCYGGERIPPTLCSAEMIPLPQAVSRSGRRICFADTLRWRLSEDEGALKLEGRGRGIRHERRFIFGRGRIEMRDRLELSRAAARTFSSVSPLVAWGLQMDALAGSMWRIHDDPPVTLQVEGTEGQLEPVQGYCARGAISGVREVVASPASHSFERAMTISLG